MPEYKAIPSATKSIEDRTVVGIVAVHGVVDEGNDRSHMGSFADIKVNGRDRARFLWMHNSSEPPIAKINYIREIPRSELPQKILGWAFDATGGVEISRTYFKSDRANAVLEGIEAGAIEEMSYAYDIEKKGTTEEETRTIRELYGLKIFDFSDVNWGLNANTLGSKSWTGDGLTFTDHSEAVVSAIEEFTRRVKDRNDFRQKEGRVLSTATRNRIITLLESLKSVSLDLDQLLKETEPKADPALVRAQFIQYQKTLAHLNGVMSNAN